MRILEAESKLQSASLARVRRQTDPEYREAIQSLRLRPHEGFSKIEAMGSIQEVGWLERPEAVANAYAELQRPLEPEGRRRSVLVVAPTHEELDRVTEAIRKERTARSELGTSKSVERLHPLHWTVAERREANNYRPGQFLVFHRNCEVAGKHDAFEVTGVREGKIVTRDAWGEERLFSGKQARLFGVYEPRATAIAAGDKLLLQTNWKEPGFKATNGEQVTVREIDEEGAIHLVDGRTLPRRYRQFDYGYRVTAHRSQGKSVDAVIVSGDSFSRELFYVAASRGREKLVVMTGSKELLREAVGRSAARQSASELARRSGQGERAEEEEASSRAWREAANRSHDPKERSSLKLNRGREYARDER